MRYEFRTMVGNFWITHRTDDPDGAVLEIDQITLGSYETAAEAAADVYSQKTGWKRWDLLQEVSDPRDLVNGKRLKSRKALKAHRAKRIARSVNQVVKFRISPIGIYALCAMQFGFRPLSAGDPRPPWKEQ